jgi:very-short-patch-repair endonuclease
MNDRHNPNLTGNSQTLRKNMTKEERHLWYDFLKGLPVVFHRQKVINNYVVDFYCPLAKLVIELDGSQHYEGQNIQNDLIRDEYLRGCGLTVKRYTNTDINQHFDSVCRDIYDLVFGNK